jgi:hypothetical protein
VKTATLYLCHRCGVPLEVDPRGHEEIERAQALARYHGLPPVVVHCRSCFEELHVR